MLVRLAERSKAPDLRDCRVFWSTFVGVGSNPTPDNNDFLAPFLVLAVIHVKMMEDGCPTKSVDRVTVSIAAFQPVDLGSIPGRRNVHFLWNFHRFPCDVI